MGKEQFIHVGHAELSWNGNLYVVSAVCEMALLTSTVGLLTNICKLCCPQWERVILTGWDTPVEELLAAARFLFCFVFVLAWEQKDSTFTHYEHHSHTHTYRDLLFMDTDPNAVALMKSFCLLIIETAGSDHMEFWPRPNKQKVFLNIANKMGCILILSW